MTNLAVIQKSVGPEQDAPMRSREAFGETHLMVGVGGLPLDFTFTRW